MPDRSGTVVIGCGGSGCNIAERLSVLSGLDIISVNTDSKGLTRSRASERILLGDQGGCDGNVKKGVRRTKHAKGTILERTDVYEHIVLTAGLGGGTGTGSVQTIAKMAKKNGHYVSSIVTIPLSFESDRRVTAIESLKEIRKHSDTLIILDSNRIMEMDHSLSMAETMKILNEITCEAIMRSVMMYDRDDVQEMFSTHPFTVALAEATHPDDAVERAQSNHMFAEDRFANDRMIIHMDGMLRSADATDVKEMVCASTGMEPIIVPSMSSAKKISVMLFIPLSCSFFPQ